MLIPLAASSGVATLSAAINRLIGPANSQIAPPKGWEIEREEYELEYGTATLEIHSDAIANGQRVLIVDDLLSIHEMLEAVIQPTGFSTSFATDGEKALAWVRGTPPYGHFNLTTYPEQIVFPPPDDPTFPYSDPGPQVQIGVPCTMKVSTQRLGNGESLTWKAYDATGAPDPRYAADGVHPARPLRDRLHQQVGIELLERAHPVVAARKLGAVVEHDR